MVADIADRASYCQQRPSRRMEKLPRVVALMRALTPRTALRANSCCRRHKNPLCTSRAQLLGDVHQVLAGDIDQHARRGFAFARPVLVRPGDMRRAQAKV